MENKFEVLKSIVDCFSVKDKVLLFKELYNELSSHGREGDCELVHVNPAEIDVLIYYGGSNTYNPITGLREFKGGGQPQQSSTSTTVQQATIPEELKPYISDILGKAKGLQEQRMTEGYRPYEGQQLAGFTPEQEQAFGGIAGLVGTGQQYFDPAAKLTASSAMTTTPDMVGTYMNPYMQNVVDIQQREAQRVGDVAKQGIEAQAVGAGSFGGSRQAILEAEHGRNLQTQLGDIQSRGLAAAYEDAQQRIAQQRARELGAGAQFGQLGQMAPQVGLAELGALQQVGGLKQAQGQAGLDIQRGQFEQEKAFPENTLQQYSSIVRGYGLPANTATTQQSITPAPSYLQQLAGLGTTGVGLYGAFGGFKKKGGRVGDGRGISSVVIKRQAGGSLYGMTPRSDYMTNANPERVNPEEQYMRSLANQEEVDPYKQYADSVSIDQLPTVLLQKALLPGSKYNAEQRGIIHSELKRRESSPLEQLKNKQPTEVKPSTVKGIRSFLRGEEPQYNQSATNEGVSLPVTMKQPPTDAYNRPFFTRDDLIQSPLGKLLSKPDVDTTNPPLSDRQEMVGGKPVSIAIPPAVKKQEPVVASATKSKPSVSTEKPDIPAIISKMPERIQDDFLKKIEELGEKKKKALLEGQESIETNKWLSLAELGTNIMAQPGGQTFLQALGRGAKDSNVLAKLGQLNKEERQIAANIASVDEETLLRVRGIKREDAQDIREDRKVAATELSARADMAKAMAAIRASENKNVLDDKELAQLAVHIDTIAKGPNPEMIEPFLRSANPQVASIALQAWTNIKAGNYSKRTSAPDKDSVVQAITVGERPKQ